MEIVAKEAIINKRCNMLNLHGNKITSVGASIIAEALNNNTTLQTLYFARNRLCNEGVRALTKTLSLNNCKVRTLCLQKNGVTEKGAEYIAEMLKTNTTLRYLLLGGNEISDRGVQHLANVLTHHNTTLLSLFFDRNTLVSDSSVDALVEMLKQNPALNRLAIEECNLSEKGKEKLRQTARSKKGFKLEV